jgi:hypothetical protein
MEKRMESWFVDIVRLLVGSCWVCYEERMIMREWKKE